MATKKLQLNSYRKSLLNRVTANASFSLYIENCLSREDEACKHSFHKVMVHNWSGTDVQLFETISEYFSSAVIPVQYSPQAEITSFYTSSLGLILKIIRQDFMFAFQRNMFNIDILFNDKTSADCFNNSISIDDIVSGVVSGRFNDKFVLDLSNFCNDPEFAENKISFYKLSLLAHFKILMLRMGRDTKTLNLSHNNLTQVPLDILNFFIKGDLTAINLSDNEIPSLQELMRVSSKIEKLWLEGNPLCEQLNPQEYVKVLSMKFPRLMELDGIRINEHGCIFPFYKNFLVTPDRKTKMVVEKFLTLYFTNYDSSSRRLKTRIEPFYDPYAMLTLNTAFTEQEEKDLKVYKEHSRNFVPPNQEWTVRKPFMNRYCKRGAASAVLSNLPPSSHDPSSFTVDVLIHNKNSMLLVVDGIYREKNTEEPSLALPTPPEYRYYSFRRTFVFKILGKNQSSSYVITNEMFSVRPANEEQIENSFKHPRRNLNELCLINPEQEESDAMIKAFMHITSLKKSEAEARLKLQDWDMKKALKLFFLELRDNKIGLDKLVEDDDFSDTSSLVDDEID